MNSIRNLIRKAKKFGLPKVKVKEPHKYKNRWRSEKGK